MQRFDLENTNPVIEGAIRGFKVISLLMCAM